MLLFTFFFVDLFLELRQLCGKILNFATLPQSLFLQTPRTDKTEVFPIALTEENTNMFDAGIMDASVVLCSEK